MSTDRKKDIEDLDVDLIDNYVSNEDLYENFDLEEDLNKTVSVRREIKAKSRVVVNDDELEDFRNEIQDMAKKHENSSSEAIEEELKDEGKAKGFLKDCKEYLNSDEFDKKCYQLSRLHRVSSTKIADTFCKKILGTIADTLGIVINVTYSACKFLIKLLNKLLFSSCGIICSIAYKLTSFFTLGYTCQKA